MYWAPMIRMTGDIRADMDKIRAFYEGKQGFRPHRVGEIRLREEDIEGYVEGDAEELDVVERLANSL